VGPPGNHLLLCSPNSHPPEGEQGPAPSSACFPLPYPTLRTNTRHTCYWTASVPMLPSRDPPVVPPLLLQLLLLEAGVQTVTRGHLPPPPPWVQAPASLPGLNLNTAVQTPPPPPPPLPPPSRLLASRQGWARAGDTSTPWVTHRPSYPPQG
jgi:hypothetical protein